MKPKYLHQALASLQQAQTVPTKFHYIGPSAQRHIRLAAQDSYKEVAFATAAEATLLAKHLPAGPLHVCDVGPGDGRHSASFLAELHKCNVSVSDYYCVDISSELLEAAVKQIQPHLVSKKSLPCGVCDIESGPIQPLATMQSARTGNLVVTFFGQTLGNVEDPVQTLRNLRNSVHAGDGLLLSVALRVAGKPRSDYLSSYQNEIFTEAIVGTLRLCGMDTTQGKFDLAYEDNAVIGTFKLSKGVQLLGSANGPFSLAAGTGIRCFISRRFTTAEVQTLLQTAGWRVKAYSLEAGDSIGVFYATAV